MSQPPKKKKEKTETMKKKQKKEIIIGAVLIALALFGTFGVFNILKLTLQTEQPLVVVTSGSMEPTIYAGDLLVIQHKEPEVIKNGTIDAMDGDIILYDTHGLWYFPIEEGVVHRVVGKYYNETDEMYYFITKGDNNSDTDPPGSISNEIPVPEDHIIGVVISIIPKLGLMKIWLEKYSLTVPLIVILGLFLVISIVWDITHPEDEEEEQRKKEEKKAQKLMKKNALITESSQPLDPESNSDSNSDINLGI